jgi:transposase
MVSTLRPTSRAMGHLLPEEVPMARRSMAVADVKEILVQWDAGEGVSRIARTLGYTRPTVRKYLHAAERVGLRRGERRYREPGWERLARAALAEVAHAREPSAAAAEVAQYHDYLAQRMGEVRLSVLHQRLRDEHGLRASWGTFYRYARAHWPERLLAPQRVTVRLADPPAGDEAQVDFFYAGRWHDPESDRERRLYAFLMTLSHSRHQFLYPVLGEDTSAWLEGHVEAFGFFGGAPRRLVPDNLSAGILRPDLYDPRASRAYGELARYYGCLIDPSRVRRPQDKPRVERGVDYARESFFRGRTFHSLQEMREAARRWSLDVAGQRIHGTTGEQPLQAFRAREQPQLSALPPKPWEAVTWTTAKVHPDCHLQVASARYSVPYGFVGRRLDVRLGRNTLEIYDGATLITTYLRRPRGRTTRMEHYPDAAQAFMRATPQACLRKAQGIGPATDALVRERLAVHALHHLREVQAVLRLAERYEHERVERACQRALDVGDGRYRTVRGILERGFDLLTPDEPAVPPPQPIGAFLRGPEAFAVADATTREVG